MITIFLSRDELKKAEASGTFLLEPCGKNTAPAIALAAHQIVAEHGHNALMLVMPADHLVDGEDEFFEAVRDAINLAVPHTIQ